MKKIIFMLIALLAFAGCAPQEETPLNVDINGTVPSGSSNQELCVNYGGTWIDEANECEGISARYCQEIGGEFIECGSACRHNADAEVCTLQCVQYCTFE